MYWVEGEVCIKDTTHLFILGILLKNGLPVPLSWGIVKLIPWIYFNLVQYFGVSMIWQGEFQIAQYITNQNVLYEDLLSWYHNNTYSNLLLTKYIVSIAQLRILAIDIFNTWYVTFRYERCFHSNGSYLWT